jgi:hypothetical protein
MPIAAPAGGPLGPSIYRRGVARQSHGLGISGRRREAALPLLLLLLLLLETLAVADAASWARVALLERAPGRGGLRPVAWSFREGP